MKIEVDNKVFGLVVGAITVTFGAFFTMNGLHIENHEMQAERVSLEQAILMSESTRYAEIAQYYRQESEERPLTEAEWARLELVERQQCRIRNTLSKTIKELCD